MKEEYPATILDYLKREYPEASEFELEMMEREIIAYQQECYDLENSDDYF